MLIRRSAAACLVLSLSLTALAQPPAGTPSPSEPPKQPPAPPVQPETPKPPQPDAPKPPAAPDAPKPAPDQAKLVYVKMTTSMGDIFLELNAEKAPISVANFLSYVDKKFYDGTIFHRVMPNFMIQGGGFTADMSQKPTDPPIKNEWTNGLKNTTGTIAMARTAAPDSATAQFFINVKDNPSLDQPISGGAGYAVFGKVVGGMDVVDKIKAVKTERRGMHEAVPAEPVVIKTVVRTTAEEATGAGAGAGKSN